MATILEEPLIKPGGHGTTNAPFRPRNEDVTNEFLARVWEESRVTRASFAVQLKGDIRIAIDTETPTLIRIIDDVEGLSKNQRLLMLTAIVEAKDFLNLNGDENYEHKIADLLVTPDSSDECVDDGVKIYRHAKKTFEIMQEIGRSVKAHFDERILINFDKTARRATGRPIEIMHRQIGDDVPNSLEGMDDWPIKHTLKVLKHVQEAVDELHKPVRSRRNQMPHQR